MHKRHMCMCMCKAVDIHGYTGSTSCEVVCCGNQACSRANSTVTAHLGEASPKVLHLINFTSILHAGISMIDKEVWESVNCRSATPQGGHFRYLKDISVSRFCKQHTEEQKHRLLSNCSVVLGNLLQITKYLRRRRHMAQETLEGLELSLN
ncbi:hypothetical protein BJ508DRAFT_301373 [Ascobolus immersus RN42]|uniref:Uncharacterized protein n=1 Tax=Ascobolus immersus RN42 TaxID=1160509 RepID=A0A3N4IPC1_ASCIM|nr:hypothetical protein BJ508DRAFT_301373 [Ascobolus immersus RN42]